MSSLVASLKKNVFLVWNIEINLSYKNNVLDKP